ncbi:2-phosphosulfolactate phosphatase [Paenibacillus sp. LMG 31456]|uniref:Probable 2-phosphosulfolactate phosphatase n=1 Tax=Paenibacillus foliorum TaxID=2654974 RepID=A0A972K3C9_9BACL|nr:2-phosphosulfolactate phosphatase [Paenibacillus foliorum]NOU97686.1 2-phosphosulfolactate phosphatase [Paenibacillus foliorum]
MEILVIPSVNEARMDDLANKTVIVIDVLRATSTMLTALAHGCRAIIPVETVLQAKQLQQPGYLLGGERACKKIPGFDYGNSPFEYMDDKITGKHLIMTTTNGTRAIQKSLKASTIIAASLLNGKACAKEAAALRRDIVILCSGTQDIYSLEDGICAGQLIEELQDILLSTGGIEPEINDLGLSMLYAYRQVQGNMTQALLNCSNGKRLSKLGFTDDIIYCSRLNLIDLVPIIQDGKLIATPVNQFI